jgi:hypothetical protein
MNLLSLIDPISTILDKVIPDKDQRDKLAHEIATLSERQAHEIALAQIEVNKAEARGNFFQSGWRPATGWICVAGFSVNFLLSPLLSAFGISIPQADTGTMMPVLMGMLGLGSLRSFEKTKGVAKK